MHNSPVRTVTVELLRSGPPHNQLLSPLTRYLAVCGDGKVGEITVPYEHSEFVRRLQWLRYARKETENADERNRERQAAIIELSKEMSKILAAVTGLLTQLSPRHCGTELVHLQFVMSAAELAMLPFELSGTLEQPGSDPGNYLQLSGKPLITMSRRSRGAVDQCVVWPQKPKILFVAADPGPPIPYQAHVDALVAALQPWLPLLEIETNDPVKRSKAYSEAIGRHLKVMRRATIAKIAQECRENAYTHIHVLAHGASDPASPGRHFGLALHSDGDDEQMHVVSGAQFASALRRDGDHGAPTVVTLAACDSANVNDVMYTGASFAQDLHRAGIPFVVASQLPLTVEGSKILAQELYSQLLLGRDPRQMLCDVRLRLHSAYASVAHDWGSVVAYALLPADIDAQLLDTQYFRAKQAMDTALDSLDREMPSGEETAAIARRIQPKLFERLEAALELLPRNGKYLIESLGLTAAARKRRAEFCFRICQYTKGADPNLKAHFKREVVAGLELAMDDYDRAFKEGVKSRNGGAHFAPLHWAITQKLSLETVLTGRLTREGCNTAWQLAKADRHDPSTRTWSQTTMLELVILRWWVLGEQDIQVSSNPGPGHAPDPEHDGDPHQLIRAHTRELINLVGEDRFPLHSTQRQLQRYLNWWWSEDFRALVKEQTQGKTAVPQATADLVAEVEAAVSELSNAFQRGQLPTGVV